MTVLINVSPWPREKNSIAADLSRDLSLSRDLGQYRNRPPRTVALVSDCYLPTGNGVARSVALLRKALLKLGYRVVLIIPAYPGRPTPAELREASSGTSGTSVASVASRNYSQAAPVYRLPSISFRKDLQLRLALVAARRITKILQDEAVGIVHTHTEFTLARAAKTACRRLDLPMLHTYHTLYEHYRHYAPLGSLFDGFFYRSLIPRMTLSFLRDYAGVICPSHKALSYLREIWAGDKAAGLFPGIHLPNGICTAGQAETGGMSEGLPLALPESGSRVILSVSRLGPEKRVCELVEGLIPLLKEKPSSFLILAGGGPSRKKIQAMIHRAGLGSRVILPGFLPFPQVQRLYRRAEVFVSTSMSENHPLTFIEAAAQGLPLVVRERGDPFGPVRPGKNGFVAETDEKIAEYVRLLLEDNDLRERFSTVSRIIAADFNIFSTAEKLSAIYERLAKSGEAASGTKHFLTTDSKDSQI